MHTRPPRQEESSPVPDSPARGVPAAPIHVRLVGCGDAFGSGGRFQTCIYVRSSRLTFLLDCGATSLTALRRDGLDPAELSVVLVTHLHGDHFGGLPFLLLDAHLNTRRTEPLTLVGPPGLEERTRQAQEVFYPGSSAHRLRFPLHFVHLSPRTPTEVGPLTVTAYPVVHSSGAPAYALRVACDGKVLAHSGDTEWTDALIDVARDADLFFCEASFYERQVKNHLAYQTVAAHRHELRCRRLVLTHMTSELLKRSQEMEMEMEMEAGVDGASFLV